MPWSPEGGELKFLCEHGLEGQVDFYLIHKMESSDFIPGNILQNFEAEHFPAQGEQSAGIIIEKAF
ncbi:Uncharacterised protein [Shigella flexneri 2a]|nr:Uncharacterised protein [Shigella flexneri 2a]